MCWLRCAWSGWWRKSFGFPLIFHDYYNQILLTDHAISWTTYVLLYYWANTFLWFFANLLAVIFVSSFLCSAGWWDVHYLGDEENRWVTPSPEVHLHIFTALDWLYLHSFIGYEPYCSLCSVGLNCMIPGDEENHSDSHWYLMISVTSYFWWMMASPVLYLHYFMTGRTCTPCVGRNLVALSVILGLLHASA